MSCPRSRIIPMFQGAFFFSCVELCPIGLARQGLLTFLYTGETHSSSYFHIDSILSMLQYKVVTHIPRVPDTMTRYTHERLVTFSHRTHSDATRDAAREVERESQNIHEHLGAGRLLNSRAEHQDIGGE